MKTTHRAAHKGVEFCFQVTTDSKWKPVRTAEKMPKWHREQQGFEKGDPRLGVRDWALYSGEWRFLDHMLAPATPLRDLGWDMSDEGIFWASSGDVLDGLVFKQSPCGQFYMAGTVGPVL